MKQTRLKELLDEKNITQAELARLIGRDKSVITLLLQGKRNLKAEEAALFAKLLNVSVDDLLGLDEAPASVNESILIPFQHEPVHCKKHHQIIKKKGSYFLEESSMFGPKAYALEVSDDSMRSAGILPGDIVISELDRPVLSGQIAILQHYSSGSAQTLLRRYNPPYLTAHSPSEDYPILHEEKDDIRIVSPVLKLVRLW